MNWYLKNKEITNIHQFPEGAVGFIYLITFSNGMKYIGRKNLYSVRKKPFGKRKLAEVTDKRLKKYEIIKKESDWKSYASSNKGIKECVSNGELTIESKQIIKVCFTDKQMTYFETQALFSYGVLEDGSGFLNDNILGKFFRRDITDD